MMGLRETAENSLDIDSTEPPFRVPKTAELVAQELRNRIIRGELREGETLPAETELMRQFSISRPTLREALRILESQSLLTVTRGSREGPRVHLPDPRQVASYFGYVLQSRNVRLDDIYCIRYWIEPAVVRHIAQNATPEVTTLLRSIIDEQHRTVRDSVAHARAGIKFHKALIELSGSSVLVLFMAILNHIFERNIPVATFSQALQGDSGTTGEDTIRANEQLVRLIEQHDADGAEAFWRKYHKDLMTLSRERLPLDATITMPD